MSLSSVTRHPSSAFRMPAEWEKHEATLLAWPHHKNDWPGKFEPIPWAYAEIIRYLTQVERVRLLVRNEKEKAKAAAILERADADLDQVDFHIIPTNRVWMRDSGPIIVKRGSWNVSREKITNHEPRITNHASVMLDFRFNAWAKYSNHKLDDKVPEELAPLLLPPLAGGDKEGGIKRVQPVHKGRRVVLEGGSIDVNGKGALLTTEECLLSEIQCRNPGFTREDYEAVFAEYLGIKQVIWLGNGITGDDTHGHVDDLARFVNPDTVVTVVEKNTRDKNYAPLQDNLKRLKRTSLTVAELPMPRPLIFEGAQLPVSYANFYIANKLVLAPTFNDPADRAALSILAECFPGREVVGIHAVDLVWGFGTIHCMSQQIPA